MSDTIEQLIMEQYERNGGEVAEAVAEPEGPMFEEETKHEIAMPDGKPLSKVFKITGKERQKHIVKDSPVPVFKDTDWDEEMQGAIPNLDKFKVYQPQIRELSLFNMGVAMGDRISIFGPTGSGKSSMVEYYCAVTRRPFVRVNGYGDLESSALLGQLTAENGSTIWKDGSITKAVRFGGTVCIDEWTALPPEILMSIQWLLEEDGKLLLSDMPASMGDKVVVPHKDFVLVVTDNTRGLGDDRGTFAGTNIQNTASLDRFGTVIHLGYLSRHHEIEILRSKFPGLTEKLAGKMVQFAGKVRGGYEQEELSLTMSPRTLLNWTKKALYLEDVETALQIVWVEKLPNDAEREAAKGIYKAVF